MAEPVPDDTAGERQLAHLWRMARITVLGILLTVAAASNLRQLRRNRLRPGGGRE